MNCPNCGAPVNPSARFCAQCGYAAARQPDDLGYIADPARATMAGRPITDAGGFFGALFDFSFSEFITTKIIKVLYILAIVVIGLSALGIFFASASQGAGAAIVGLIIAPIFFLLYVIVARVWMELIIVIFRIAQYAREIAQNGSR